MLCLHVNTLWGTHMCSFFSVSNLWNVFEMALSLKRCFYLSNKLGLRCLQKSLPFVYLFVIFEIALHLTLNWLLYSTKRVVCRQFGSWSYFFKTVIFCHSDRFSIFKKKKHLVPFANIWKRFFSTPQVQQFIYIEKNKAKFIFQNESEQVRSKYQEKTHYILLSVGKDDFSTRCWNFLFSYRKLIDSQTYFM